MTRLCFGEFDWPDASGKRSFAQRLFLLTLQKLNQAPLRQLYGEPFQLYRMAKNEFHLEHYFIRKPWLLTGPAASLVETLEAQIERWAKTWNLDARWCTQTALETLHLWSCASREITELCFQPPTYGGFVPTRLEPPEGLPGYAAFEMRRDEYLEDIRSKALEAIAENPLLRLASGVKARAFVDSILVKAKNYCDEVEAVYLEQDWKHCRKDEKKNLNQHFEWTVEFQVHAKPFAQIARESTRVVTAKAVAKAVREMLSLILLKERGGVKRGRPKGSRTIYHAHNPSK